MKKTIEIANKTIGNNKPCFIIAEAGINHNGDIKLAKKLIGSAKDAGADAVKFQTYIAEDVVTEKAQIASYQKDNLGTEKSQLEMLRQYELDYKDFKILKGYCDEKSIIFLSTPHSEEAAEFLEPLVPAFKIGSGDLTNIPFLEKVAEKGKPMIVGTGMSTLNEVKEALQAIHLKKNKQAIMLHCTTDYPCPLDKVNLLAMKTMQKELDCLVGYSDHTLGLTVPIMAATLGAVVIEKHFTLDRNMPGPDHKASLEPDELKSMVHSIREVEEALGEAEKRPTKGERKIMSLVRKSILAGRDLTKGDLIERDMLAFKRPGDGLDPRLIEKVVGKRLKKRVKKDAKINLSDLE
jgi:N-acetylneuraminate synthase